MRAILQHNLYVNVVILALGASLPCHRIARYQLEAVGKLVPAVPVIPEFEKIFRVVIAPGIRVEPVNKFPVDLFDCLISD